MIHTGDVRDYVTWLVVGTVLLGAGAIVALGSRASLLHGS